MAAAAWDLEEKNFAEGARVAENYSVVYDSTRTNLWWWLTWSPVFLVASLMVLIVLRDAWRLRRQSQPQKLLFLAILVLVCASVGLRTSFRYYVSRHFYHYYGPYTTIEGVVKNYEVFRTSNSIGEQFDVNDIHFGYIDMIQQNCFHRAAGNGGPIHEGLQVRISYAILHVSPCIVKLEVSQEKH